MREEMKSLYRNKTWNIVPSPKNQKLVTCRWLYKIKEVVVNSDKPRFNARVVA